MNYEWAEGHHPPKGVTADQVKAALDDLPEPSPEAMLEASKRKRHVLHEAVWSEGDQVWASRGRLDYVRRTIAAVREIVVIGGKSISIRAVEFVKPNGEDGRWASLESIRKDPELIDAYMAEVQRLQDQAAGKMAKLRELMRERA